MTSFLAFLRALFNANRYDSKKLDSYLFDYLSEQGDPLYGGTAMVGGTDLSSSNNDGLVSTSMQEPKIIHGTFDRDNIYGTDEEEIIYTYGGNDEVRSGGGDDSVYTEGGNDYVLGWTGNDYISGGFGDDKLFGNDGDDYLSGSDGSDFMDGGLGNDTYAVHDLTDTLVERVSEGSDYVYSLIDGYTLGTNLEALELLDISSVLKGTGNSIDNQIFGNIFNNALSGLEGNDVIDGQEGDDAVNGGLGHDSIMGNLGNDTLKGSSGDDRLSGGDGDDTLRGDSGKDELHGSIGKDNLIGGSGDDFLTGRAGFDTLTGGTNRDIFSFLTPEEGIDTVTDFVVADDVFYVAPLGFGGGLTEGVLKAEQFRIASSAQSSSDRIIYNQSTGALYFDQDGIGGVAQVQFAKLSTGLALTNQDFNVITVKQ